MMGFGLGAPEYLSVPNHMECLGTYNPSPSYTAKCLPTNQPTDCPDASWAKIKQVFDGDNCPIKVGLGAPEYLSVPNHMECLGTYNPSPSYTAKCLPTNQPTDCPDASWAKIKQVFDGDNCPIKVGLGAPEYLSVPKHMECLGTYNPSPSYTAKCLPTNQPTDCPNASWNKIKQVFDGENCPMGVGLGAPEYLSVPNHTECLGTYNPTPSYTAKCLPTNQPTDCPYNSWAKLKQVFDGDNCPNTCISPKIEWAGCKFEGI